MKTCVRCVMNDQADPTIRFDQNGNCNYCTAALQRKDYTYFNNEQGKKKLAEMLEKIKADCKDLPYDCMMGISGGLDSSYLAYLGHQWGLRILALHIDDGFDTDISKSNIDKLVKAANLNMIVIKPDPEQYYGLLKAYMKAGVPNLAVPQDNLLSAELYRYVKENRIKYFLAGGNYATESLVQQGNSHDLADLVNMLDIHKKFGEKPIDKLAVISEAQRDRYKTESHIETLYPLNYVDYNRDRAFAELKEFCGFEYYGRKHLENMFTAFLQTYWLPQKFNVDKRTSHLSSMIVSGQMSRDAALEELKEPLYDPAWMDGYIELIKEKLELSDEEFASIMAAPTHKHTEFKTSLYNKFNRCIRPTLGKVKRLIKGGKA